jgi:ATP-dependent Lon protease
MLPSPETTSSATAEPLEAKINRVFGNVAIDKRRLRASALKDRGIPGYVAEWVLDTVVPGTGPLSIAEATKVNEWAARVVPKPDEGNILRNQLYAGQSLKLLTPVQVDVLLTQKRAERVARLPQLGIHDAHITDELVTKYPALLKQGMWGVAELLYIPEQGVAITGFRPMQATVNLDAWREARGHFTLDEWRALLLTSMGYNPTAYTPEQQMLVLARLLPLVQKNLHLMELAPKGTGKSYVYENISPMVRLISGGNVSPAVLFVNNSNALPGLLARYSVVVLDEIQTLKFESPAEIVGGLKGYLANGLITRGGLHQLASDCGFVMLANIKLDAQQRPVADPLMLELPSFLQETAFLDRMRGLIPGWQIPKLTAASFAQGSGLKADYFGDILIELRHNLEADAYCAQHVNLSGKVYQRNQESVRSLTSGYFKLLFPDQKATTAEFYEHCIRPAVKLRQGIWNQLYNLDAEYRQFDRELLPILG